MSYSDQSFARAGAERLGGGGDSSSAGEEEVVGGEDGELLREKRLRELQAQVGS